MHTMLIGFVSDENYAALPDTALEFRNERGERTVVHSSPSGAVCADLRPDYYEVCLSRAGYGSKRVRVNVGGKGVIHFRMLSDRPLGYAWPKWCRAGDSVEFRVHSVEPYKLGLWRYGFRKECVRHIGWFDDHGPRAVMQILPDDHFVEEGVKWKAGHGLHGQRIIAPLRSGLHYFHARTESGQFFSFPLVVAPRRPSSMVAVLAATNTWNAYNPFGGRSNYILAACTPDEPIVNSWSDLPRYKMTDYGEWKSAEEFNPLSFDRPEPVNAVPEHGECTDPIEGRTACHLAPTDWRLLAWLEREGHSYDYYSDYQLHDGTLDLDAYRVLILGPHPEYWSEEAYHRVKRWVFERGGRLMYLGGNGINCKIEFLRDGTAMRCLNSWPAGYESRFHRQVESEANLLGVVYSDPGAMTVAPYEVVEPDHWVFADTGLKRGDLFGTTTLHERYGHGASGHETDKVSPSSPKDLVLLAKGLNPDEGGAHLVYFDLAGGGAVFSAGSITYPAGLLCDRNVSVITSNVLRRMLGQQGSGISD
jgi:hypothetical protein